MLNSYWILEFLFDVELLLRFRDELGSLIVNAAPDRDCVTAAFAHTNCYVNYDVDYDGTSLSLFLFCK